VNIKLLEKISLMSVEENYHSLKRLADFKPDALFFQSLNEGR